MLLDYLKEATAPHQAVAAGISILKKSGFKELSLTEEFKVAPGGKYFLTAAGTTLIAVTIGKDVAKDQKFHIAAAHTDHPCLHIKPKAELAGGDYLKLDVEVYGGPILNTWLDRPLSIAGRVALRSDDIYKPELRLVDFKRPLVTIPNLAIHMNRKVNEGVELNKQNDMLPILGAINKDGDEKQDKEYFLTLLAKELKVKKEDILDFDLYVYNTEEGSFVGAEEDMISAPRLDNLTSCYAILEGITSGERANGINVGVLFDHEEIGSRSKQGADSAMLKMVLEKIYAGLGFSTDALNNSILSSFLFSVDVAHAVHPAHTEKYDPVNVGYFNSGIVLKLNSNQKYTFDTEAVAIAQALCEKGGVKYQKFANRSDVAGGSTLGPIISGWLPMKTVDIGVPILAMHSARELMGRKDQEYMEKLMKTFYTI
ncbi:MAG: M18 family aminopeptidase [Lachnospiraceae bacterium]|nr:M18 family aminopeptidase [Lachnospiraceae bacterium]